MVNCTSSCRPNLAPAFNSSMTVSVQPHLAASISAEFPRCGESQSDLLYMIIPRDEYISIPGAQVKANRL